MKYFDPRHWSPLTTPEEVHLVADVLAGAPRGGTDINCCAYCIRPKKNARLRTCGSCEKHYCGRRACRLAHAFVCGEYRPHWPKKTARTKGDNPLCSNPAAPQRSSSTSATNALKSSPTAHRTPTKV